MCGSPGPDATDGSADQANRSATSGSRCRWGGSTMPKRSGLTTDQAFNKETDKEEASKG
jgi:hypothetical protein